ncbi:MAG: thioredoxin family protein [Gammaproteobacteria bacterium]|nr:thioredoxin family protein [Gammaproteobacteria bacterium]
MMMRFLLVLSLFASFSSLAAEKPRDAGQHFFNDSFWDFSEELQNARESGKQGILIMFEMDECPFCHRMKTTILNQPDVQDYFRQHFMIFPVDIEGDVEVVDFQGKQTTMKDFAFQQYRVRATPVFAFFDLDGKYIKRARFTGATRDKDEFMLLGKYVVEGAYEKETFTRYKRSAR